MKIKHLRFMTTTGCNLRCKYCYEDEQDNLKSINLDYSKECISLVLKNTTAKTIFIEFFGGEPLLDFSKIKEIIKHSKIESLKFSKKVNFGLITNGILITKNVVEYFKQNNIIVEISIDGDKPSHDLTRKFSNNTGSFEHIIKAIKLMENMEFEPFAALITITPKTVSKFYHNMIFLDQFKVHQILKDLNPEGKWTKFSMEIYKNQLNKLCESVYKKIKSNERVKYPFITTGLDYLHNNKNTAKNDKIINNTFCGAGHDYITITPNKSVYPCARFYFNDSYKLADSIHDFIKNNNENKKIFKLLSKPGGTNNIKCSNCKYHGFCQGYSVNCHAKNQMMNEDLLNPFDLKCEITEAEFYCINKLYKKLYN
jgi:uncharacterized protein